MNSNGQYVEREITINVSVDNLRNWAVAGWYQGLRQQTLLKPSDEVQEITDVNWAGLASLPNAVIPVRLKIKTQKEVYGKLHGEGEEL